MPKTRVPTNLGEPIVQVPKLAVPPKYGELPVLCVDRDVEDGEALILAKMQEHHEEISVLAAVSGHSLQVHAATGTCGHGSAVHRRTTNVTGMGCSGGRIMIPRKRR